MNCPYCNNPVTETIENCPNCGANLQVIQTPPPIVESPTPQVGESATPQPVNNQNNKKKSPLVPIVLGLIIIMVIAFLGSKTMKKEDTEKSNSNSTQIEETKDTTTSREDATTEDTKTTESTKEDTKEQELDTEGAFFMEIEDIFTITGEGIVVTGTIDRGTIKVDDEVEIVGKKETRKTTVTKIVISRESQKVAQAGENVGIYLNGMTRNDLATGQVLAAPNSVKAVKKFDAQIYALKKEEGGRQTPFFSGYQPNILFKRIQAPATLTLPNNIEKVSPGDTATVTIDLKETAAVEVGKEFKILEAEDAHVVAKGTVTKIY